MEQIGKVITIPVKTSDIWSGMVAVLCSANKVLDLVTVEHMTMQGNYYVVGKNMQCPMTDDMFLAHLHIQTDQGKIHKLKFNQWNSAMKSKLVNTDQPVSFVLLSSTFSTGYYLKICNTCGAHYNAAKKQIECEDCTDKNRYAKIVIEKKEKRPRIKRDDTI